MSTTTLTFYGASDDIVELHVDGQVLEEYAAYGEGARLRLTALNGETLDVFAKYGYSHGSLEWAICVEAVNAYPSWPIRFHERPDRAGDPAVSIETPLGTVVEQVGR